MEPDRACVLAVADDGQYLAPGAGLAALDQRGQQFATASRRSSGWWRRGWAAPSCRRSPVREAADRANLVVRPLSPRLYRKLAIVIRRDKVLHLGLRETIRALQSLSRKGA